MPTYDKDRQVISMPASGDLSAYQWHIVTFDSSEQIKVADDADDEAEPLLGILENAPSAQYEPCLICISGKSKCKTDASVTAGAALTCSENATDKGQCIATTTVGDHTVGYALADGDDADIIPVMVSLGYHPGTS